MTILERAAALEDNIDAYNKVQYALGSLVEVERVVDEAARLDELTTPLLNIAAGLANSTVGKLNLDPIYHKPEVDTRGSVATAITTTTERAYLQLLPIRNRATGELLKQFTILVRDQMDWVSRYKSNLFHRVRSGATYGPSDLSGVRKLNDEQIRKLLANGIENSTHQKPSELIISIFSDIVASILAVASDQHTAEYLERNVERFPQGDGFSPVRFDGDRNLWRSHITGFNRKYINLGAMDGQAWSHDSVTGERCDSFQIEPMTLQDITIVIEQLTASVETLSEQLRKSALLQSDEMNNTVACAVIENPLHIKLYGTYYGDSSITEEVSVMINRVADVRLAQLRYVSYGLGNLISALPLIMNYCLQDKIN